MYFQNLINAMLVGLVCLILCGPVAINANAPDITMVSCSMSSPSEKRNVEKSTAYCEALVQYLNVDLSLQFAIAPPNWTGKLLNVDIRLGNEHVADVHLEVGSIDAAGFSAEDSRSTKLISYDRPISAFTLRALIRDIGHLLGTLQK